mmetsp:Transcript_45872/g.111874  ORF Transcript_45872/g.111874 Transcript_45872/m.111874 type:complete len:673 (+) Transcript_45872:131-2149(+)
MVESGPVVETTAVGRRVAIHKSKSTTMISTAVAAATVAVVAATVAISLVADVDGVTAFVAPHSGRCSVKRTTTSSTSALSYSNDSSSNGSFDYSNGNLKFGTGRYNPGQQMNGSGGVNLTTNGKSLQHNVATAGRTDSRQAGSRSGRDMDRMYYDDYNMKHEFGLGGGGGDYYDDMVGGGGLSIGSGGAPTYGYGRSGGSGGGGPSAGYGYNAHASGGVPTERGGRIKSSLMTMRMYGGRGGGGGGGRNSYYDDSYYDDYDYFDGDDEFPSIEPYEGSFSRNMMGGGGRGMRNELEGQSMTDEYDPSGVRRFRSGMPSPTSTAGGVMGGGGVNGPRSRPIVRGRGGPAGGMGGMGGPPMPYDMMYEDEMMMGYPPMGGGGMDYGYGGMGGGMDYMGPGPRGGGRGRGGDGGGAGGPGGPSRSMSRGSEPVQGSRSMSEMYVPGRDPSTEAGAAKAYGGGGGGGGYDDFGGPPGVDDGDRMMYQPGMDLGDIKPGMYGDGPVDDDDGYDYDENNFQKPRGGRGGAGSKGRSSSSRSSANSRKTLDVEVEESPPRRRSGRDGPNGESKGASARAGRGETGGINGSSKKKKSSPKRGRGGPAAFDDFDDDDDDFEEPYFVNMPNGRSAGAGGGGPGFGPGPGRGPLGKKKFDARGFYYEDEDGHKTYVDIDDGEW